MIAPLNAAMPFKDHDALNVLLARMLHAGASDLHLAPPGVARIRQDGQLSDLPPPVPDSAALAGCLRVIATPAQSDELAQQRTRLQQELEQAEQAWSALYEAG